jgi:hypothetical protein
MNPFHRNEEELALDGCLDLTLAEQAAVRLLGRLQPEPCPPELAERTVRCLCAMAQEIQAASSRKTSGFRSCHQENLWLCLSSNILMG